MGGKASKEQSDKKDSEKLDQIEEVTPQRNALEDLQNDVTLRTEPEAKKKIISGIQNTDVDVKENLFLVSQYIDDIYDYLYDLERKHPILKDHLSGQKEVTHKMRAVLVDWINAIHRNFDLVPETFQLTVAIIDRYLQAIKDTKSTSFQLVGVTALYIATKYVERFKPPIEQLVLITASTYTAQQIRRMEVLVFKAMDWNLSRPLPIEFLQRYLKGASEEKDELHQAMSQYFIELAAMDYDLSSYWPSEIAAASLFLSRNLLDDDHKADMGLNDQHWSPTLTFFSRYSAAHLRPIARQLAKLARNAPKAKLKAVFRKYSSQFHKIALRSELSGSLIDSIIGQSP